MKVTECSRERTVLLEVLWEARGLEPTVNGGQNQTTVAA